MAGVEYINNVGAANNSMLSDASNQWGTSMVTLRGKTKVNDDLSGIFHLETGFGANNGAINGGGSASLFSRFSTVGVDS